MKKLVLSKNLILISAILACTMPTWGQGDEKSKTNKPLVVFVTGDHEYGSESTMPLLAAELEKNYGMRTIVLKIPTKQRTHQRKEIDCLFLVGVFN